jgi:hypothetical protein
LYDDKGGKGKKIALQDDILIRGWQINLFRMIELILPDDERTII